MLQNHMQGMYSVVTWIYDICTLLVDSIVAPEKKLYIIYKVRYQISVLLG